MKQLFYRIQHYIESPNGIESDSRTLVALVRIMCLLIIPHSALMGLLMTFCTGRYYSLVYFAGTVTAILCLRFLRAHPVQGVFHVIIAMLLLGAIVPTFFFGWNLAFQTTLYCAVLLALFNPRFSIMRKQSMCVAAFGVLVAMEIYARRRVSAAGSEQGAALSATTHILLVNELFFLAAISLIGLVIASLSQESEHALLVYNEKLKDAAGTDPLTGLYNRRHTLEKLDAISAQGKKYNDLVTVAMGDIDFFKRVNDTYGHDVGDLILKEISRMLLALMGDKGFTARWGGEEFLLVFIGANGDDVFLTLDGFLSALRGRTFSTDSADIAVTMTFGVAEYNAAPTFETTIREADEKLYLGKQSGRDRVIF